ncbi:hypothetical protein [Streptomyces salinarius]|uniref:hypothetical protein n=1 Tax=Streptomyces salinarius TaxID=2762598 RepID=UPI0028528CDA|nr:hypothetical protein [Streptomyces salinarius]
MSAPVHRSSERPSAATLAAARQRREEGRAGTSSGAGTSAEQALLGLQSSAGNRAATATVQRARGRTLERTPGTDTARPGSAPGARHAPAGLTRRGSAPGALGDRAPLGTGSGTRPASVAEVRVDTSAPEPVAAPGTTAATRFAPSGRTRRGSDTDTRPGPTALTRRGSESGTHGLEVDPGFQEHVDTAREEARTAAAERAAAEEAARRAALAARFTSTGRTRRGSDTDTRPDPATLTRRGSESGTHGLGIDPVFQTELDTARDAARVTEAPSGKKSDRLKEIAENADQGKRILDPADALGKGVQAPTAAGLGQQATEEAAAAAKPDATPAEASGASAASVLKHDAAAAGVAGASLSAGAELLALGASVADAFRNLKTSLQKKTGAGYHNARRKAKVKAGDAGMSVASTGANAGAIAKEAIKVEGVASTAASAEASGVLSGVAGVAKSIRALGKTGGAIRKYRNLGKLPDAETAHAGLLARLKAPADAEEQRAKAAYDEVVALQRESEQGRPREGWQAAFDAAVRSYEAAAHREAQAKLTYLRALNDARTVDGTKKFARRKQVSKAVKEGMGGGLGEGLKGAGGIATVAIVATGALASNPAGWIVAAAGAGLVVLTAGYKGVRSGYGRFQEVHHPERYTPHGEEVPEAKPTWESLKHAMKVWKKVSKYKRQLAAHKLYDMVSRPDTEPELRRSALDLLVVLKAGPSDHGMDPRTWQESLMDPAAKADWIKEITDQLSSGS